MEKKGRPCGVREDKRWQRKAKESKGINKDKEDKNAEESGRMKEDKKGQGV